MQLAFYKGPPTDQWHRLSHWLTCRFTGSPYSHVELVINGTCYSASARDGGVRAKQIDLNSGRWDVVGLSHPSPQAEADAFEWFAEHAGHRYDWAGVLRRVLYFPRPVPNNAQFLAAV